MNQKLIKRSMRQIISGIILIVLLFAVDQITKYIALNQLAGIGSVPAIRGILNFSFVKNTGAAFGSLMGRTYLLSVVTGLLIIFLIIALLTKYIDSIVADIALILIISGGIGNLTDRIRLGYVIDFFDITPLFSFPVFNFADCCVVIGVILLLIYILFIDKKKARRSDE